MVGFGVIEIVILSVAAAAIVQYVNKKKVTQSTVQSGPAAPTPIARVPFLSTTRAIASCWLAPTGVMVVFVGLSGVAKFDVSLLRPFDPPRDQTMTDTKGNSTVVADESLRIQDPNAVLNRPKWIDEGESTAGDVRKIVLSSRLWSTVAEAKQELQTKLAEIFRADFDSRHHGLLDPKGYRFISDERMAQAAVKEQYVELVEQDFGKFSAPMNRVWWQVEISPFVRTELYPAWKTAATQNRVIVVGSVLAILTLMANAIHLFVKLRRDSNRSTIPALASCGICILSWVAVELVVAARLLS